MAPAHPCAAPSGMHGRVRTLTSKPKEKAPAMRDGRGLRMRFTRRGADQSRSSGGSVPPLAAMLRITCLCSQMFQAAEPGSSFPL